MSLLNRKIMATVAGVCMLGMVQGAQAQSTCWFLGYDPTRTAEFGVVLSNRQAWDKSEQEKKTLKETELKIQELKKGFKKKQLLESASYDYMSGANCSSMGSNEYLSATDSMDTAKSNVYENFFLKPYANQVTQAQRNDIVRKRHNYLRELSQEVLSLSYGYQAGISEELKRLSKAPTEARGNIQQIELLAQTKKTMVEEKAAELLFQAKLMELEAAQMLLGVENQYVCDPDKKSSWPTDCKDSSSGSGS